MAGFWTHLVKPFFVMAPMADVTDVPFRSVIAACGRPDVFYTEFVSAHGLASAGRDRLLLDLAITKSDHPIVAQFFGTLPEHMEAAGRLARELGFDGVDINMGCPDRSIMKQGAGASLIRSPALARELVAAVRQGAGGLPVAVKTRLGLSATQEMDSWIPGLLEARPDVLIVHGRTVAEMSAVPAHWDCIARAATMAHERGTLCVGNGDVDSRAHGIRLAGAAGADGVMVGRGIFHDPWLFSATRAGQPASPRERVEILLRHTDAWTAHWHGIKSFDLMKKFFKAYVSGWAGAVRLRSRLMEARDAASVHAIIADSGIMET